MRRRMGLETAPLGAVRQLAWLGRAFAPASLMLAVTTFLSTDIAAIPLLWIVPLSLYLLTFIVAFGARADALATLARRAVAPLVLPLVVLRITGTTAELWFLVPLHLAAFTAIALGCHARLAADRPAAHHLTAFYLWMAAGGALGGLFNSVIAPRLFNGITEYPIVIALGCALLASMPDARALRRSPSGLIRPALAAVLAAVAIVLNQRLALGAPALVALAPAMLVGFTLAEQPARFAAAVALMLVAGVVRQGDEGRVLHAERTFFGVYRVTLDEDGRYHSLYHGTTLHGRQGLDASDPPAPLTYYHRKGPIGQLIATRQTDSRLARAAVVGLGTGSLAGYVLPGEQWRFFEIDPAIERIARDARYFTYLSACGAACDVVLGDARLSLLDDRSAPYDLVVLDAFSSDAVPVHLLTREAVRVYLERLAPGGVLAFHISNRHIGLEPVLAALAGDVGLVALDRTDLTPGIDPGEPTSSEWLVMARDRADFGALADDPNWSPALATGAPVWTDDYSNVLGVLRWR